QPESYTLSLHDALPIWGQLAKIIAKVSSALEQPYQELLDKLPLQSRLHVDETGHPDQGERWWTWCFRAGLYTLFKIDPTRSGDRSEEHTSELQSPYDLV